MVSKRDRADRFSPKLSKDWSILLKEAHMSVKFDRWFKFSREVILLEVTSKVVSLRFSLDLQSWWWNCVTDRALQDWSTLLDFQFFFNLLDWMDNIFKFFKGCKLISLGMEFLPNQISSKFDRPSKESGSIEWTLLPPNSKFFSDFKVDRFSILEMLFCTI